MEVFISLKYDKISFRTLSATNLLSTLRVNLAQYKVMIVMIMVILLFLHQDISGIALLI